MEEFKGKVVFITGGNSGIGEAVALAFAERGTKIALCARRRRKGEAVVEKIEEIGGEAIFIKTDVSKAEDVESAVKQTVETFGALDFAFNNAGVSGIPGAFHTCTDKNWHRIVETNLSGVFYCMRSQIVHMLAHGGGAIVNMASLSGLVGTSDGLGVYSAAKHGVVGLTRNAALEYAQNNIRVNAVCPAVIETPMIAGVSDEVRAQMAALHPMGRIGTPSEVAGAVLFLCSDRASFMTGVALPIDGGAYAG